MNPLYPAPAALLLIAALLGTAHPAYSAVPAPECKQALDSRSNDDDSWPAFLADRETLRLKYRTLESITDYPDEFLAKFDANIKILFDPEDSLAAKILLIRNAEDSVDIGHFILKPDRVGRLVIAELKTALGRGVNVRVLVDAQGSRASLTGLVSELKALLAANPTDSSSKRGRVEIVVFNPLLNVSTLLRKWVTQFRNLFSETKLTEPKPLANNRLHDKIVAADLHIPKKAVAILGGRGIEDIYYAFPDYSPKTFRDMEIIIRNPRLPEAVGRSDLGQVLGAYYNSLYYHLGNKYLSLGFRKLLGKRAREKLRAIEESAEEDLAPGTDLANRLDRLAGEGFLENGFALSSAQFVHESKNALRTGVWRDDLDQETGPLVGSLREHFSSSKETIDIVTPYAWFTPEEAQTLRDWVDADPKRRVRIITNSVATGDSLLAQSLVDSEVGPTFMRNPTWKNERGQIQVLSYGKLDDIRYGGSVWYGRLHAKYFLFDGKIGLVTSFNGDPRSRYWNTESGFYLAGLEILKKLQGDADFLAGRSLLWGSPDWEKLRNHPLNRRKTALQNLLGKLIRALGLTPLV